MYRFFTILPVLMLGFFGNNGTAQISQETEEMYKREINRLTAALKRFQDAEFKRTGLLADGMFLRTGWVSLNNKDCGIYGQDEWACKKPIEGSTLTWGVGCVKDAPKCESGKAVSTTAGWSRSYKDNKHDKSIKACVQQWIRWECGSNPINKSQEIDFMHMGKYNEWRKDNKLTEKKFTD